MDFVTPGQSPVLCQNVFPFQCFPPFKMVSPVTTLSADRVRLRLGYD